MLDRLFGERKFARREQLNTVDFFDRELRLGIEGADRFDVFVEQFDPVRHLTAHRKQIDDGAAYREFAVLVDLRHALITDAFEFRAVQLQVEYIADADRKTVGQNVLSRR